MGGRTRAGVRMANGDRMMAKDATPLIEAVLTIIEAARAYLPPNGYDRTSSLLGCLI
jgi:hypothetical protein